MERNKGPGLMHKLGFRKGSKRGEKVQVQEVEEIPEIVDKGKDNKKSGKEKHNEKDELQTNADKGPGLKETLRFWRGSKRGEKVQVQDVEEGVQVTEEIPEIVDSEKEKHNEEELQTLRPEVDELQTNAEIPVIVDSGKEKNNEEELQTLRSEVDEPQTKADKEIERKGTLTEKIRNQEQEKESEKMKIESLKKLMEEVRKSTDIPEREKESWMEKIREIEKEKDALLVQIGFEKMEIKSFKKLKEEVSKRKDISAEKESLMEKIRKFKQEKESLKKLLKEVRKRKNSKNCKPDHVQEREETSEIVDKGKDSTKDALQIEVERLQKENNELKVELEWRRARTYADNITLNSATAHPNLSISEDKKKFIHEPQPQKVPSTPERFDSTVCVLGSEGFSTGKHYWEVDVRSSTDWDLGVARTPIQRKGKLSLSPKEGFWALGWSGRDYWAKTDPWTRVEVQKKPKKIGVYLSYQEGQVTFFNVTDMSVFFTFNDCSFSEEVYPFFKNSHKETSMRICSLREDE